MEKRLILAIALSMLVLLIWSRFVSKMYHLENKEVTSISPPLPGPVKGPALPQTSLEVRSEAAPPALFNFSQENFEVVFDEARAIIKEVEFKNYQSYKFSLEYGFLLEENKLLFKRANVSANSISFNYADKDKEIIKEFDFSNSNYTIELNIIIKNLSDSPLKRSPLVLGVLDFSANPAWSRYQDMVVASEDKVTHPGPRPAKEITFPDLRFLGLRDRYFCAIIEPVSGKYVGFAKKTDSQKTEIGLLPQEEALAPGEQIVQKFRIYLGPQELKRINAIKPEWAGIIYYGFFDLVAHILVQILEFFYNLIRSWGWAIIILSFTIYIALYPLTLKQMQSMRHMQQLQPHIEEIKRMYKDNPQKQQKAIMELYQKHKVNPFSGCLPFILQIPIFVALYQVLSRSINLKGAHFLWIKDLSEPDRFFTLSAQLPIIGKDINILPVLMALGMFVQQKLSQVGVTTPEGLQQQKMLSIVMPVMMGFIFYTMPSGLVLYWLVNSSLMLAYQLRVKVAK